MSGTMSAGRLTVLLRHQQLFFFYVMLLITVAEANAPLRTRTASHWTMTPTATTRSKTRSHASDTRIKLTLSATMRPTMTVTASTLTASSSNTKSGTVTPPPTPTSTLSYTVTPPPTPTATLTGSQTASASGTQTATITPPPTPTPSATFSVRRTPSSTGTRSLPTLSSTRSLLPSATPTLPPTPTVSPETSMTSTHSRSYSRLSASLLATVSPPPTITPTASPSGTQTATITPPPTPTPSATFSLERTPSSTGTRSLPTLSSTRSLLPSATPTTLPTPTVSSQTSMTSTHSNSPSQSERPSLSLSPPPTPSASSSPSHAASASRTHAQTSSRTTSPTATDRSSASDSVTRTAESTRSRTRSATPSLTTTRSPSPSLTTEQSDTSTLHATPSDTQTSSRSATWTPTFTVTPSRSQWSLSGETSLTETTTATESRSQSDSPSASLSLTDTPSGTVTLTDTETLTTSVSESATATMYDFSPHVTKCFVEQTLHAMVPIVISVAGRNLDANDHFLITQDRASCVNATKWREFESVFWVSPQRDLATIQWKLDSSAPFSVCYLSQQLGVSFPMSCQQVFYPEGVATWVNTTALGAIINNTVVSFDAKGAPLNLRDFNSHQCLSAFVPGGYDSMSGPFTTGPLLNPVTMSAQFGNSSTRIGAGELCVFYVTQPDKEGAPTQLAASLNMSDSDKVNALNSTSVHDLMYEVRVESALSSSDFLTMFAANEGPYAEHMAAALANLTYTAPSSCLLAGGMNGMVAVRRFDFGVTTIRLPPQPFALVACSAVDGSRGLYASMTYRRVLTLCPNDCRDGSGVEHGECSNTTGQCECFAGYSGPDCSTPIDCRPLDDSEVSSGGNGVWYRTGNVHCGVILRADGTTLTRGGGFSIALRVTLLRLNSSDCKASFVTIRRGTSTSGVVIKTFCGSDAERTSSNLSPVMLVADSKEAFVEYKGSGADDVVRVEYMSVSTSCPGPLGRSGFVAPQDVCDGRGVCTDIDFSMLRSMLPTSKTCACNEPWGASSLTSSCDQCAKDRDPYTFPTCVALPKCPWDCNNRGECTADGCVCRAPYYGRVCELVATNEHLQAPSRLLMRLALDGGSGASAINGTSGQDVFLSCQVSGCSIIQRTVGLNYRMTNPHGVVTALTKDTRTTASGNSLHIRQFEALDIDDYVSSSGGSATSEPQTTSPNAPTDEGIALNSVVVAGAVGDYVAQSNISNTELDVSGQMTFSTWVRLRRSSYGFLFAKAESVWYGDNTHPLLEAAFFDIEDRHADLSTLKLRDTNSSVYFAIFVNGPRGSIDVLSVDVGRRDGEAEAVASVASQCANVSAAPLPSSGVCSASSDGRENWFYSRRFAMNGEFQQLLFDGEWHFFALTTRRGAERWEGQVYVDGASVDGNVNFVQCLPFLPNKVSNETLQHAARTASGDVRVSRVSGGGVVVLGYGLSAALDEIRLYSPSLSRKSIVSIGGPLFSSALSISDGVLLIAVVSCLGTLVATMVLYFGRREGNRLTDELRRTTLPATSEDDSEEDMPSSSHNTPHVASRRSSGNPLIPPMEWKPFADDAATGGTSVNERAVSASQSQPAEAWSMRDAVGPSGQSSVNNDSALTEPKAHSVLHKSQVALVVDAEDAFLEDCLGAEDPVIEESATIQKTEEIVQTVATQLVPSVTEDKPGNDPCNESGAAEVGSSTTDAFQNANGISSRGASGVSDPSGGPKRSRGSSLVEPALHSTHNGTQVVNSSRAVSLMQTPKSVRQNSIFETDEAIAILRYEGGRESSHSKRARRVRSTIIAATNAATNSADTIAGSDVEVVATLKQVAHSVSLAQGVWQTVAAHMSGFPWPENFLFTVGTAISVVSLNFEVSFSVTFELTFYLCAAVGLTAFASVVIITFHEEVLRSNDSKIAERTARKAEMKLQIELTGAYKPSRTGRETAMWLAMLVLTTLYMPITRNSVIGAFCYYSIQCEFDCYNEQRHWNVVYLSAVQLACVTVFVPVLLGWATWNKRREFIGNRIESINKRDPGAEEDTALEKDWRDAVSSDTSAYSGAYENFRYRWGYFQAVTVLSKALCIFLALGLDRDTGPQLLSLTFLHCVVTFAVAYTSPFIADVSNHITMVGQGFIVLSIGLNAISRLNPDEVIGTAAGVALMVVAAVCLVTQVILICRNISLSDLLSTLRQLIKSIHDGHSQIARRRSQGVRLDE